jgi:hypothetical protein
MALSNNPSGGSGGPEQPNPKPDAQAVDDFHTNADTDLRQESIHHTLGPGQNQGSPGNHRHRGGDSELLLAGITITGSRGGNAALLSVINALVELGATNSSTA